MKFILDKRQNKKYMVNLIDAIPNHKIIRRVITSTLNVATLGTNKYCVTFINCFMNVTSVYRPKTLDIHNILW